MNTDEVQKAVGQYFNVSPIALAPIALIAVLSSRRVSAYLCLMIPAITAVVLAGFTQHDLIVSKADEGRTYLGAVLDVGIDTFANGFALGSGIEEIDRVFTGGGTSAMLTTIWLVLVAASFGAIVDFTGMLGRVIAPVIASTKGPTSLIGATMLSSIGLNAVTADPYTSIELTGRMFRHDYEAEGYQPVVLSTSIADSGTMMSHVIPWNIHGALFAGTLGIGAVEWAPYTFVAWLTPIVTFTMARVYFRRHRIPEGQDAAMVYGPPPTVGGPAPGLA